MAYTALAEIQDHLGENWGELSKDMTGVQATAILTRYGGIADGTIDSYLKKRYAVPITSTDAPVVSLLRGWSLAITAFLLFSRVNDSAPEDVGKLYDDTLGQLRRIATGELDLPSVDELSEVPGSGASVHGPARIFTRTIGGSVGSMGGL